MDAYPIQAVITLTVHDLEPPATITLVPCSVTTNPGSVLTAERPGPSSAWCKDPCRILGIGIHFSCNHGDCTAKWPKGCQWGRHPLSWGVQGIFPRKIWLRRLYIVAPSMFQTSFVQEASRVFCFFFYVAWLLRVLLADSLQIQCRYAYSQLPSELGQLLYTDLEYN